jgi:hypothetical protein
MLDFIAANGRRHVWSGFVEPRPYPRYNVDAGLNVAHLLHPASNMAFVLCNGYSAQQSSAAHLQGWFGVANLASHVLLDNITYCILKEL